jgi:cyclopropane-fatty-acyl-phospholipid synthase
MMNLVPLSYIRKQSLKLLTHLEFGSLHLVTPEGEVMDFKGSKPGPNATLILHDWRVAQGLAESGDIAFGEDYINGLWETDDLEALIALFLVNPDHLDAFGHGNIFTRVGLALYNQIVKRNSRRGSRKNIKAHYDVGNDFYRLWLDEGMTYSSALFSPADSGLYDAQSAKYQRILSKVNGAKSLLEVGCGWGGFAEAAARDSRHVTGLTISPAQFDYATKRLGNDADIRLQDYRDVQGKFDAIVSIEMFEAVGEQYWRDYFGMLKGRLKAGGTAMVQTITIRDDCFKGYRMRSDFIRHYVFPGGMLPSVQRFREEAAKADLQCMEVFSFGQDYARTLRTWLKRFEEKRSEILAMGYSEAFIRNWRFYMSMCAAAFATGRTNVVQVELAHAA